MTPRHVTSHGKSVSPCMAHVASRDRADSALLAWIVVKDPAVPGVERLQEIGGLAAPDLADHNVVGPMPERVPDEVPDRHRFGVDPPGLEADTVFPVDPELQGVLNGNNAVGGGEQLDQGIEQAWSCPSRFPPDTRIFRRPRSATRAASSTSWGSEPKRTRSSGE